MILICFALSYVIVNAWERFKENYHSPDNGYRRQMAAANSSRSSTGSGSGGTAVESRPAKRQSRAKYTTGWIAYELRHGWPVLRKQVAEGWVDARREHEDWTGKAGKHRARDAFGEAARRVPKYEGPKRDKEGTDAAPGSADGSAKDVPASAPDEGAHTASPEPAASTATGSDHHPATINGVPSMTTNGNGSTPGVTGDGGTDLDAYRQHNQAAIDAAAIRQEEAALHVGAAEQAIAVHEQVYNDLRQRGISEDMASGMADLMEAGERRKAAALRGQAASEVTREAAQRNLDGIVSGGHAQVEEDVNGMSDEAAEIDWYRHS